MSTENRSYAGLSLLRDFPEIVERHLCHKEHTELDRNRDILFRRYGIVDGNVYTLQELGTFHGVTRERVRQVQARIVAHLRKLLTGTLRARGWAIEAEYLQQFASFEAALAEQGRLYSTPEIEDAIEQHLGDRLSSRWLTLFLDVLDYERVLSSQARNAIPDLQETWVRKGTLASRDREGTFEILKEIHREVNGRSIFGIVVQARQAGAPGVDPLLVRELAGACMRLEEAPGDCIRPRFSALTSAADRAWRVLAESETPMHYSDIARDINRRESVSGSTKVFRARNIANQMVVDPRFAPVGRSGLWSLTRWEDVETLTIIQVMERLLHAEGKPLPVKRLASEVCKLRPDASEKSVRIYAETRQELFGRTSGNRVTLKVWGLPETDDRRTCRRIDPDAFLEAVRNIARNRREIKLKALAETLAVNLETSEASCRQWFRKLRGLEMTKDAGSRSITVRFVPGSIAFGESPVKITKRERIQAEIRRCRTQRDTRGMTGKQLHQLVNRAVPCPLPTFYQCLAALDAADAEYAGASGAPKCGHRGRAPTSPGFGIASREVAQ